MNKFMAYAAVLAFGGLFSGTAFSAVVWGDSTQTQRVTAGVGNDCPLLADAVTLGVSANVIGGYACDETNNIIQVAACHQGGSRSVGAACVNLTPDPDPVTGVITETLPDGCADATGNSTIPSFRAFMASSSGGIMSEVPLDQRCTEAQMGAIDLWVN